MITGTAVPVSALLSFLKKTLRKVNCQGVLQCCPQEQQQIALRVSSTLARRDLYKLTLRGP